MRIVRYIWNSICVIIAFLSGWRVVPLALNNLADIERHSGVFRDAVIMASAQGFGCVLLVWVGCFCLSSPRWNHIGGIDRILLVATGLVLLGGMVASIVVARSFTGRVNWYELAGFLGVFLAIAGPGIFLGQGHVHLLKRIIKR